MRNTVEQKQSTVTLGNYHTKIREELYVAMRKAGFDATTLRIDSCTLDNTWGDLVGFIVRGDEALAERAARWMATWIQKRMPHLRSYTAQVNGSYRGKGSVILANEGYAKVEGHLVSSVYYSGSD